MTKSKFCTCDEPVASSSNRTYCICCGLRMVSNPENGQPFGPAGRGRHQHVKTEHKATQGEPEQFTAFCSCGNSFVANTEARAIEIQHMHSGGQGGSGGRSDNQIFVSAAEMPPGRGRGTGGRYSAEQLANGLSDGQGSYEITDNAAQNPDVHELPALTTLMSGAQFQAWLDGPGQIFIVYLPGDKSFIIKVPEQHHAFFVAMMKQIRMVLGPKVQAQSASPVTRPGDLGAIADDPASVPVDRDGQPAPFIRKPEEFTPADEPLRQTCPGSGQSPRAIHYATRGECRICYRIYKLTSSGMIRAHRQAKP